MARVIISGGGTGGHVFPAIAIANSLRSKQSDIELLFVGASDRMEMEKVPAAGYKIIGLWISGFQRSFSLKNLSFPFKLIHSMIRSRSIINSFKPDVVVGVGLALHSSDQSQFEPRPAHNMSISQFGPAVQGTD